MLRARAALTLLGALVTLWPATVPAAELIGTIKLDRSFAPVETFNRRGYWKIPNEVMELRPPAIDPRMEMVVVLRGSGLSPRSSVEPVLRMQNARFNPTVLPVRPNQEITIKNDDGILHILEPAEGDFIRARRVDPGTSTSISLEKPGAYKIRCSEVPHMRATIFVAEAPRATLPNRSGQFSFADLPPGAYTLRVWYGGGWVYTEPVALRGRTKVEIKLEGSSPGGGDDEAKTSSED